MARRRALPPVVQDALDRARGKRPAKPTKYHSRNAVDSMGVVYDSEHERHVAEWLELRQYQGIIARWKWGPRMLLQRDPDQPNTLVTYKPDFIVWPVTDPGPSDPMIWIAIDAKGFRTKEFNLKARLWRVAYPDHPLYVVGKDMVMRPA